MEKDEYLNQDINHPKYLFHGSPKKLKIIEKRQSHDSSDNKNNISDAIFLFPSFLKATPYAFKDTIKENSSSLNWNFIIPNSFDPILMEMENVNIDYDIVGYIYVFKYDDSMIKDENSYQYKCFKDYLVPYDVIEVKYKDYMKYYRVR